MLRIENLTKTFGDFTAVNNLSIHIRPGEIYGFIGHNGAGKTTTLKSVAGIQKFDSGQIAIDGKSIIESPLECKKIFAYIPDNPDLYDYLSGIQYLEFIADIFEVDSDLRATKIHELASEFEIEENLAQPISDYSHGMKQKLALVSAFMHDPKLIIMDEPFVGLDPSAAHRLKLMMRKACDNGSAIFFSTHVLEVAEKLCDKIAIIKQGNLVTKGTMDEVRGDDSLEDVFLELVDQNA